MICGYINLDRATERRGYMEAHFAELAPPGVPLTRTPAIDASEAASAPGGASATEKACFLSHLKAIRELHDGRSHLLVLEDDVILSPAAFTAPLQAAGNWDLLLLDAAIGDIRLWPALEARRQAAGGGTIGFLDLAVMPFACSAAYLVNRASKERVLAAFATTPMNAPYDITMRALVHAGRLRACLAFPFVSSIAAFSDNTSQIRAPNPLDELSNAFRRRIFDGVGDGRSAAELAEEMARALKARRQ